MKPCAPGKLHPETGWPPALPTLLRPLLSVRSWLLRELLPLSERRSCCEDPRASAEALFPSFTLVAGKLERHLPQAGKHPSARSVSHVTPAFSFQLVVWGFCCSVLVSICFQPRLLILPQSESLGDSPSGQHTRNNMMQSSHR